MRLKSSFSTLASVEIMSVLASPGTPTSRQWPRANSAASSSSITWSWPMMTLCSSRSSFCLTAPNWAKNWAACSGVAGADGPVVGGAAVGGVGRAVCVTGTNSFGSATVCRIALYIAARRRG